MKELLLAFSASLRSVASGVGFILGLLAVGKAFKKNTLKRLPKNIGTAIDFSSAVLFSLPNLTQHIIAYFLAFTAGLAAALPLTLGASLVSFFVTSFALTFFSASFIASPNRRA